jgi:NitT/TauT family transport system substrate-binding protein
LPTAADAQPLRLVVAGLAKQIYLPAVLADRLGYFAEQHLQVELVGDASGVRAEDRLLAGAVHGVIGFYDHTVLLQAKGKFVRSVVQFSRAPGEAVVAGAVAAEGSRIAGPADFRGRTLGVAGLGSSTHLLMQYLGAANGVPAAEMNFVVVDSPREFSEAMASGRNRRGHRG